MAYTTAQLAALQAALASGRLSVSYAGMSTTYRSVEELRAAIREVEQGIADDEGTTRRRAIRVRTAADRGY